MNNKYFNPILLVDDEEFNLHIMNEYLQQAGYNTITATNGQEALDKVKEHGNIKIIILDKMMPKMHGVEFINKLKELDIYNNYSIIMQTAASSDNEIIEGIKAGVYYYLTKPYEKELLLSIINTAIENSTLLNEIKEIAEDSNLIFNNLLSSAEFKVYNTNEAKVLAKMLANLTPNPENSYLGIQEIIINAIEHGNLGISYEQKKQLLLNDNLNKTIEKKLVQHSNKFVLIKYTTKNNIFQLEVIDQGDGFKWQDFLEINPNRVTDPNGRGIAMAKKISFDSLEYNDKGNIAYCKINI